MAVSGTFTLVSTVGGSTETSTLTGNFEEIFIHRIEINGGGSVNVGLNGISAPKALAVIVDEEGKTGVTAQPGGVSESVFDATPFFCLTAETTQQAIGSVTVANTSDQPCRILVIAVE